MNAFAHRKYQVSAQTEMIVRRSVRQSPCSTRNILRISISMCETRTRYRTSNKQNCIHVYATQWSIKMGSFEIELPSISPTRVSKLVGPPVGPTSGDLGDNTLNAIVCFGVMRTS